MYQTSDMEEKRKEYEKRKEEQNQESKVELVNGFRKMK